MKQFDIPVFYRSPIISAVKNKRKIADPRKKDFHPAVLPFSKVLFYIPRHFGFCYGVENAIEISYRALSENPEKRIFLLSQMIHNPAVNEDLNSHGIKFIQDTYGNQLIPWSELTPEDVVIIPAFGTSLEMEEKLNEIGVTKNLYNTTCPFVEKVWNRAEKLGQSDHTIVIHGKYNHEETRATFSHSQKNAPSIVVKDMDEAHILGAYILGEISKEKFNEVFESRVSAGFNPEKDLTKVGVVNQTTMLAMETQGIADYLHQVMIKKYGENDIQNHFADTRDTLCYATNDNQSATDGLLNIEADLAIVVGGYNSSNTTHLVELLEPKFSTYFINDESNIHSDGSIESFDIHTKEVGNHKIEWKKNSPLRVIITSGASCPDATVDRVIRRVLEEVGETEDLSLALEKLEF